MRPNVTSNTPVFRLNTIHILTQNVTIRDYFGVSETPPCILKPTLMIHKKSIESFAFVGLIIFPETYLNTLEGKESGPIW